MKNYDYIFRCVHIHSGRGHRSHHTHRQHKAQPSSQKGSDKPPGKAYPYPNRNAKFAPFFSRGEFGVFLHAYFLKHKTSYGAGCRSPPFNSTRKSTRNELKGDAI